MAAELKLTKITPTTGTSIDVEGNLTVGTDAVPRALEVKGNLTVGVDIDATGDLDVGGDIIADNISIRDTPTLDDHLITKSYFETYAPLPRNFISGFDISVGSDTDHEIDIAIGECIDSTNVIALSLASPATIDIEESGAGGLDTGSVANDTWYYIFAIYNTSTGTVTGMFSTSKTNPTMPSGYTYKRRIRGAVLTDGSANISGFYQKDDNFWYTDRKFDHSSGATPGTSRVLVTMSVPPNMIGHFHFYLDDGGSQYVLFGNPNESDVAPSSTLFDIASTGAAAWNDINKSILVDSASQIYYRHTDGTVTNFYIFTNGFIDPAQS